MRLFCLKTEASRISLFQQRRWREQLWLASRSHDSCTITSIIRQRHRGNATHPKRAASESRRKSENSSVFVENWSQSHQFVLVVQLYSVVNVEHSRDPQTKIAAIRHRHSCSSYTTHPAPREQSFTKTLRLKAERKSENMLFRLKTEANHISLF